jgi:streptomycin 6-kinase
MTGARPPSAAQVQVPTRVAEAVRVRWPELAPTWCRHVLGEFNDLCDRYRGVFLRVLPARYGLVVAVATPDGPLVMRSSPDPAGPRQAQVSEALAKLGIAPAIHEVIVTVSGTWTVMERIFPGGPVQRADVAALPLDALARLLGTMNGHPAPIDGLPSIADWLHHRLTSESLVDVAPSRQQVAPTVLRREALATLADLRSGRIVDRLCHGDTSLGNVLGGSRGQLFLVDPRGVAGEVEYDAAVFAIKAARPGPPMPLAAKLAARAGMDIDRVQAWVAAAVAACV